MNREELSADESARYSKIVTSPNILVVRMREKSMV